MFLYNAQIVLYHIIHLQRQLFQLANPCEFEQYHLHWINIIDLGVLLSLSVSKDAQMDVSVNIIF